MELNQPVNTKSFLIIYIGINDRFFCTNPMGFSHLGHSERPNKPYTKKDIPDNSELIGDDLGRD